MAKLLRDARFFEAVKWNPHLKIVMDHRTVRIAKLRADQIVVIQPATDEERRKRGLAPWSPQIMEKEMQQPALP